MSVVSTSSASSGRFLIDAAEPSYLRLYRGGALPARVEAGLEELRNCRACPRNCGVDRFAAPARICHTGRHAIVSSAFPHFGEEDCLRGVNGSGTIFFGACNLRCVFCQNWDISQEDGGRECNAGQLADLMLRLQDRGCHNINFVTPEHVVPQVIEAIAAAIPLGLKLPIVYNTGAYDALESLRLMDGLVDIYMPDFKCWTRESARRYLKAKDYPERAREAILEMQRQVGPLRFENNGIARRGLLVRHLVMPGQENEAAAIFDWLAREVSPDTYINIMGQYRPEFQVGHSDRKGRPQYQEIARVPARTEMRAAYAAARHAGLWRFDQRRNTTAFG